MLAISFISAVNRKRKKRREARGLGSSTDDDSDKEAHKPGGPAKPALPPLGRLPPASGSVIPTSRAGRAPPLPSWGAGTGRGRAEEKAGTGLKVNGRGFQR
uniref:Macaca fascicularis brain cDNA clone: QtrA-19015, similar to human KIAA1501 protein (KIAA1501), mRNA, RefSeq: XM_290799.4 n=1 Tax=Macaca fascicularis TaxID=9541 RepID=I7GA40_MACFA|nr:unnamed protein product [Macaca fascicularis]